MPTPRKPEWTASAMGRKGGKAKSPAKTRAASANAKKRWAMMAAQKAAGLQIPDESAARETAQRQAFDAVVSAKPVVKRKEPPHDD